MDINSPQAQYLAHQFTRGRMQATVNRKSNPIIANGFVNLDENQAFVWTNHDRLVRIDSPGKQLNVIAPNRQYFEHIIALAPDEVVISDKVMHREDLLPLPTMLSRIKTQAFPMVGTWLGFSLLSSVGALAIHAAGPAVMYGVRRLFHWNTTPAQIEAGHQAAVLNDAHNGEPHFYPRPRIRQAMHLSDSDVLNDPLRLDDIFDVRLHHNGQDMTFVWDEMSTEGKAVLVSSGVLAGVLSYKLARGLAGSDDNRTN